MNISNHGVVYHGSPQLFGTVTLKENTRIQEVDGEIKIMFQGMSFHATPYKWIALAYTYDNTQVKEFENEKVLYNISVNLYQDIQTVFIHGFDTLEKSLQILYGKGGFVYHYNAEDFFYTEGLGDLEVITQKEIDPIKVEDVNDPVYEMKKLDIKFVFINLSLPENKSKRRCIK